MDFSLKAVFGIDATGVRTEMKQLRKEANDFASEWAKIGFTAAAATFIALSKSAIDLASRLSDTSQNIGINVESLQALEAQHKRNGVSSEQLTKALEKLRSGVEKAREGDVAANDALKKLHLTWQELADLPLEKKYERIGIALRNAEDKASAYNAVNELFGEKVGPKLMASLDELANEGFDKVAKQAREAGQVMSAETIVALDRAGDAIDDFKKKATVAIGNIIVNFRSTEGLELLLFQFLKVVGQFGAGIVDAVIEGGEMVWAVFKGAFLGVAGILRDGMLDAIIFVAKKFNDVMPDWLKARGWTINIAGLEELKGASGSISEEITKAIAETSPSTFKKEVGEFWDKRISDQQKIVDAMNKKDFGVDAQKLKDSGKQIEASLSKGADDVAASGKKAAAPIVEAAQQLTLAVSRTGKSYEDQSTAALQGVASRLQSQLYQVGPNGMQIKDATVSSDYGSWAMATSIRSELAAVQNELALRAQVASFAQRYGEDAARANFGDSAVDRALRDVKDASDRTTNAVETIASGLAQRGIIPIS